MKRLPVSVSIWVGNAALLVVAGVALWHTHTSALVDRRARDATVAAAKTGEARIVWPTRTEPHEPALPDIRLSPIEREREPAPVIETPPVVIPEKTAAQRKAELEAHLGRLFRVMRLMLACDSDLMSYAMIAAGGRSLLWHEGMSLQAAYAKARSPQLQAFAMDVKVLRVDGTGVLVDAAGIERPDERFEIHLRLQGTSTRSRARAPKEDDAYRPQPHPPEHDDEVEITQVLKRVDGGLEVTSDPPSGSFLEECGVRAGDVIVAVNARKITTIGELRRTIRIDYDAGISDFVVTFMRGTQYYTGSFSVPAARQK